MGKLFVVVDVGCIECGEESTLLGIFKTTEEAEAVARKAEAYQEAHWHGQHAFYVWEGDSDG